MSEFISGVAMLLILLIFPMQAQVDTINAFKINNLNQVVYNAAERARFDGSFKPDNVADMKSELAKIFNVSEDKILIEGTTSGTKYRTNAYDVREKIEYKVTVPFGIILPSAEFLNIDTEINGRNIVKKGFVFSEVLRP